MIINGLKEIDIREIAGDEGNVKTLRFADDYENNMAIACRLTKHDERDCVSIQNEGYSRVVIQTADQAERLIVALQAALDLEWFKR